MSREIERRGAMEGVELRSAEGQETMLVGYAAVFNSKSEDLGFREIIMPGAFDRALKEKHDVRALVNHNSDLVLGRTKAGTLKLTVDEHGLLSEITLDMEDPDAVKTLRKIKRGSIDGMSFAFITLTDEFRTVDGEVVREISDLELLDVSVVAYPAYPATQVSARALEQAAAAKVPAKPEPGVPNAVNEARLRMAR